MFVRKTQSSEPKYMCYFDTINGVYYYSNLDVLNDPIYKRPVYTSSSIATSLSDLKKSDVWVVYSITEDRIAITDDIFIKYYDRYSDGDLYISETKHYAITKRYLKHNNGDFNSYSYGVTGSPTVSADGLASGFSTANYLTTPKFPTGVTNLEMVWKVKFSSLSTTQYFYNTAPYYSLLLGMSGSKFRFWISNNTSSWDISEGTTGNITPIANTWYYVKFTYDGSTYRLYTSTDNNTWNLEASLSSTKTIGVNYDTGRIGHGFTSAAANNTTIDLKESYIKINGEYWWSGFYTEDVIDDKKYILTRNGKYY